MTAPDAADERGGAFGSTRPPAPFRPQAGAPDGARLVLPPALARDLPALPDHPARLEPPAVLPGLVADAPGALRRARPLRGDVPLRRGVLGCALEHADL